MNGDFPGETTGGAGAAGGGGDVLRSIGEVGWLLTVNSESSAGTLVGVGTNSLIGLGGNIS